MIQKGKISNGVNALVLRAAGINCDVETQYALELSGAAAERIHVNRIIENPDLLKAFHILIIPGGFSYGDDVAAGKILANQIIYHLSDRFNAFIGSGKIVLGICNGFQVLVKTGILGKIESDGKQQLTITNNDSGRYEDRWVYLEPSSKKCVFIDPDRRIYLPMAHGEGKIVFENEGVLEKLKKEMKMGAILVKIGYTPSSWEITNVKNATCTAELFQNKNLFRVGRQLICVYKK